MSKETLILNAIRSFHIFKSIDVFVATAADRPALRCPENYRSFQAFATKMISHVTDSGFDERTHISGRPDSKMKLSSTGSPAVHTDQVFDIGNSQT